MLYPQAKIIIYSKKKWVLDRISSCEIERGVDDLTATCTITLPKKAQWFGAEKDVVPVHRGDRMEVYLGYAGNIQRAFDGYVKTISLKSPVEITCQDDMFLLKKAKANKKSYKDADLTTVLSDNLPKGMRFEVYGTQRFGKYVVNADTVAEVLSDLKENGFFFFFQAGILKAGMIFDHAGQMASPKQLFRDGIGGNIIDASSLEYSRANDLSLLIRASGTDASGKKISVEVGDKDGETRSFFKYNTTLATLKEEATKKLTEWKVDGLSGDFTTFGHKIVGLLDLIKVQTQECPVAIYRVTAVVVSFGADGLRQKITISGKSNE